MRDTFGAAEWALLTHLSRIAGNFKASPCHDPAGPELKDSASAQRLPQS